MYSTSHTHLVSKC